MAQSKQENLRTARHHSPERNLTNPTLNLKNTFKVRIKCTRPYEKTHQTRQINGVASPCNNLWVLLTTEKECANVFFWPSGASECRSYVYIHRDMVYLQEGCWLFGTVRHASLYLYMEKISALLEGFVTSKALL